MYCPKRILLSLFSVLFLFFGLKAQTVANCKDTTLYLSPGGVISLAAIDLDDGSAGIPPLTFTINGQAALNSSCVLVGVNQVFLLVEDAMGNKDSCLSTITVLDALPPQAICNTAPTLTLDNQGNASLGFADINAGSNDNCGITSYTLNGQTTPLQFNCSNVGSDSVELQVFDASGNVGTCLTVVNIVGSSFCSSPVFNQDSIALASLRAATGGGNGGLALGWQQNIPNANAFWLNTIPITQWYGVEWVSDGSGNLRVKEINLSSLALADSLPTDLFANNAMDSLAFLILDNNNLRFGPSGNWFVAANNQLEVVDISNNNFVYDNLMFERMFDFAVQLKELKARDYLGLLQVGNNIPNIIGSLTYFPNLEDIRLGANRLIGEIPNPYNISTTLDAAEFDNNAFTSIDTIGGIPNLEYFNISQNSLASSLYIRKILNEMPFLRVLEARNALNLSPHPLADLDLASDFDGGSIDLGENRLTGTVVLSKIELNKLKHLLLDNNLFSNLVPADNQLDSLQTLDLGDNQILVRMDSMEHLFISMPNLRKLSLRNNSIIGKLPPITILNNPVPFRFEFLKELDLSGNFIFGKLHLEQLLGLQLAAATNSAVAPPIEKIILSNNFFNEIVLDNNAPTAFPNLKEVKIDDNRINFRDMYRLVAGLGFERIENSNAFYDYYAPKAANYNTTIAGPDSLAFDYRNQRPRGVGGIRRRPPQGVTVFSAENPDPKNGQDSLLWNSYQWYQASDSTINPQNHTFIGSFDRIDGAITALNDFLVAPIVNGLPKRDILAAENLDSTIHGNKYYYALVSNDSFPLTKISTGPKKLILGECYDDFGRPIQCQQIIIEFDEDLLALSSNPDSIRSAVREEFGITVIDSCLCGTIELWELSDTSNLLELEALGRGTRTTAYEASTRTELLSADPNYDLLEGSTTILTMPSSFPSGTTNTEPTLIAMIDSGVDYEQPELQDRLYVNHGDSSQNQTDDDADCLIDNGYGYSFIDDNALAYDDHGHGTNVAGILAGKSTYNILPNANTTDDIAILPLKYTNKEGAGTAFHAACAIRHAADFTKVNSNGGDSVRVRVINASWGYYGEPITTLYNSIEYAAENCGILFVTSAGNDGIDNDTASHYPSGFELENIIVVAAVENPANAGSFDYLEDYSNFGTNEVDIAASGYDLTTAANDSNFVAVEGTSFATAQLSRVAAQLFHDYPEASYYAVKYAMMQGVDVLNSTDSTLLNSKGRVNYTKALAVLDSMSERTSCSQISTGTHDLGRQATTQFENIKIYPNPFEDQINIELGDAKINSATWIRVRSLSGHTLLYQEVDETSNFISIPLRNLAAGMYLLELQSESASRLEKIIKFE